MSLIPKPANSRNLKNAARPGIFTSKGLQAFARAAFVTTPRKLFRSKLSNRSSSFMMLLCIPAIALFISATVPEMIFQSPQQEAYFYFARTLSQDLTNGFVLALSVICMMIAFVLPAAEAESLSSIRH
jgi:hypothetical protein